MKSFQQYLNEGKDRSSSRVEAMDGLVHALKTFFDKYDLPTRTYVWEHLQTAKGKDLVHKILRNPKITYVDSDFRRLLNSPKK